MAGEQILQINEKGVVGKWRRRKCVREYAMHTMRVYVLGAVVGLREIFPTVANKGARRT